MAARRWMQLHGLREDQVTQVRGFADQSLRNKEDPEDATNRRVSLIIQYKPAPEVMAMAEGASGAVGGSGRAAAAGASGSTAAVSAGGAGLAKGAEPEKPKPFAEKK